MMYLTEDRTAYSSSIASVIEGMIVLNHNGKNVGKLKEEQHEESYLPSYRKPSIWTRFKS